MHNLWPQYWSGCLKLIRNVAVRDWREKIIFGNKKDEANNLLIESLRK